jgi:hypothetical protein
MSIYREINDIQMDLQQYEEQQLSDSEMKRWEKRIFKKIHRRKTNQYVGISAAILIGIGIVVGSSNVTVANVPFVSGMIEKFINGNEQLDYSPLKTAIGESAINEYGKMTLNEVLMDSDRLIMSSTLELADGVDFSYRMHPMPKVLMNGHNLAVGAGGQSIQISNSMYTIYNEIIMTHIPIGEYISFHIEYDHIDLEVPIQDPWIFDVHIPTDQLAATTETIQFDRKVEMSNGHSIRIDKLILSPVSTMLYYDSLGQESDVVFKIVSESGVELLPISSTSSAGPSYNRFSPIDLHAEKYDLVLYESFDSMLRAHEFERNEREQYIPINLEQ